MVEFEKGNPEKLRSTALIYSNFSDFGKTSSQFDDFLKETFQNKSVGLFTSSHPNYFVSGIDMLTRDPHLVEIATAILRNSQENTSSNSNERTVFGLILPFKKMYETTIEGDLIYAGNQPSFQESVNLVNMCMKAHALSYAQQNMGKSFPNSSINNTSIQFMKTLGDFPEDKRLEHLIKNYVQPLMYHLECNDLVSAKFLSKQLDDFCYDSNVSSESKIIRNLVLVGNYERVAKHLELLVAISDERYLDAAKIRDSISNNS